MENEKRKKWAVYKTTHQKTTQSPADFGSSSWLDSSSSQPTDFCIVFLGQMDALESHASLRSSWQFPATQKLLSLVSTSLNCPSPSSSSLEDALVNPQQHLQLLADLHGRMHGFALGASAAKRWLAATAKRLDNFPTDEEMYCQLTPVERVVFLYELVDTVCSEGDALSRISYEAHELRIEPFGCDAVGNQYWYFGDCQRVYRSPSARASQKVCKEKEKEEKRRKETEKKEAVEKRRMERKKKQDSRWGHRVSSGRVTRASRRVEERNLQEKSPANGTVKSESTSRSGRGSSRSSVDASPSPAKRPRKQFEDSDLRVCTQWETICTDVESLEEFVARFGLREKLVGVERVLIRRIVDEIVPVIREEENRTKKEAEKKARTEFMMTNQKRSTRVQAITARREEEARREAQREEAERMEEERVMAHQRRLQELVKKLVAEQSRDIREERRQHGKSDAILRDATKVERFEKIRDSAPTRRSKRQRGIRGEGKGGDVLASGENPDGDIANGEEGNGESRAGSDANDTENTNGDISELDKNDLTGDEGVESQDKMKTAEVNEKQEENEMDGRQTRRFSNANREVDIESKFTWSINAEDRMASRVLERFFFAFPEDFGDAPLEACDKQDTKIMGVGIVVTPLSSTAEAARIVIDDVSEWMFEYGREPKLWIRSEHAWYELRQAAVEYRSVFASAKRKFELCARISILGEVMRGAQLSYDSILGYLSQYYGEMDGYDEDEILKEKRYIVAQMGELNKKSIVQSGFMRGLQKIIRVEDKKKRLERGKAEQREEVIAEVAEGVVVKKEVKQEGGSNEIATKKTTKRRPSGKTVPRVVTMLVNEILKTATKSYKPPKKRKYKAESVVNGDVVKTAVKRRKVDSSVGSAGTMSGNSNAMMGDKTVANGTC